MDGLIPTTARGYANLVFGVMVLIVAALWVWAVCTTRWSVVERMSADAYGQPRKTFEIYRGVNTWFFALPVAYVGSEAKAQAWIDRANAIEDGKVK